VGSKIKLSTKNLSLRDELQYLEEESASTLNRFYNTIGHIKKEIKQK